MDIHLEHVQLESVKGIEGNIASLQVASNSFVFGLSTGRIYYIDLDKPSIIHDVQLPMMNEANSLTEKLLATWLSGDGCNLLVKTNFANYYVVNLTILENDPKNKQRSVYAIKKLQKKDLDIRHAQWIDPLILLCGTANGKVIHIDFIPSLKAPRVTVCWNSKKDREIQGLLYSPKVGNLLVVVKDRLLLWKSSESAIKTPTELLKGEPAEDEDFKHLNQRDVGKRGDYRTRFTSLNDSKFAWATSSAVIYGDISVRERDILNNANILFNTELPDISPSDVSTEFPIKGLTLTDYHIIVLRGSTITAINQLNNKVIFQENISVSSQNNDEPTEVFIGLTSDNYNEKEGYTFWCYSNSNVYEIIVNHESQAVWSILCDQQKYDEALRLGELDSWEKSLINFRKGSHLLETDNNLKGAAESFGKSDSATIGSIALKFMKDETSKGSEDSRVRLDALQDYLIAQMGTLRISDTAEKCKLPKVLLSSWIVWNFMQQLNDVDEQLSLDVGEEENVLVERKNAVQLSFNTFLEKNVKSLNPPTIYKIISNQNRTYDLLFFARLINDYEYMISYWIKHENWYESLKILLKFQDLSTVYKYSTILLVNSPDATVSTWMKINQLTPDNLLPAILTYFTNFQKKAKSSRNSLALEENYALVYLLNYIENNYQSGTSISPIIYNTVLYMMISVNKSKDSTSSDDNKNIIKFVQTYEGKYDSNFVLKISMRFDNHQVTMHLLSELGLYDDAITIGLQNNMVDESKKVISKIGLKDSSEVNKQKLQKRMWLKIATHVLSNSSSEALDIKQTANSFIVESAGVLEIKDLLPLCDKMTTVANLKDELIKSLENHNERMNAISGDIKRSITLKERIKADIKNFDKNYNKIEPGNSCDSCGNFLQSRKFIVFPCNHCYHKDCIIKLILNSTDYNLIGEIQKVTKSASQPTATSDKKLETLLSTKCYLCSDMNINKIDDTLLIDQVEKKKWSI